MNEDKRYAVSAILSNYWTSSNIHCLALFDADSKEEAMGKAYVSYSELYPDHNIQMIAILIDD